jgi:hypothetical protein
MDSRKIPQPEEPDCFAADAATFLLVPGWCRLKVATPSVTMRTTPYLYKGYFFRKMVRCKTMTGRSLHDLARIKVR